MSDTLHIACVDCKKQIWVGQKGIGAAYLYGTPEAREVFGRFYSDHSGHDMRFTNMDGVERLDLLGDEHQFT